MARHVAAPVLDERWAAFIQSGVSTVAASRDSRNFPAIVRAVGCRVPADRKKVTLVVSEVQAKDLVQGVRSTGTIAVVFTLPSTHVSLQLKGSDAKIAPVRADDVDLVERYTKAFIADLLKLGYNETLIRALLGHETADLIAVTFTPNAAFIQTPGPGAGNTLGQNA